MCSPSDARGYRNKTFMCTSEEEKKQDKHAPQTILLRQDK